MSPRPEFGKALRAALVARFPAPTRVAISETPSDLSGTVIVVDRIGGGDSTRLDYPVVDIDVFAPTLPTALDVAEQVRDFVRFGLPGMTVNSVTFTDVTTTSGPSSAPYPNTNTRRIIATYRFAVH